MTITQCLIEGAQKLREAGVAQPEREAASILMFALNRDRTFLISHNEYELTEPEQVAFDGYLARREMREPFQHIVGKQEFYGLDFEVSPDVLIPRPETELLVETAIDILRDSGNPRFCEIGTGSGCIAVSVLHELKDARALAVDISENAIRIAKRNAHSNNVSDRIAFARSDIFSGFEDQKFDAILSNPPYIPAADIPTLQAEVRDFDPLIALTDGGDGLSIIKGIIDGSPEYLSAGGFLLLEIGFGQAETVAEMFDRKVWDEINFLSDLQGIERVVKAPIRRTSD